MIDPNEMCVESRQYAVKAAISQCQLPNIKDSVICITNTLKICLNEYWDAFGMEQLALAGVSVWYWNDC